MFGAPLHDPTLPSERAVELQNASRQFELRGHPPRLMHHSSRHHKKNRSDHMFFNFLSRGAAAPPTAADKENVDPHPLDALADLAEEHEAHDDGEPQEKDEDDLPDGLV